MPLPFRAALGAAEALGEVLREVASDGHGLRLELLRELQQPVRRGPPDRRRPGPRRRRRAARMVPARAHRGPRGGPRRSRLDAPQNDGVVLLQVERDLDQLLPVVGAAVGAPRRGARAERPRRRLRRAAPSLVARGGAAPHRRPNQKPLSSAAPGTVQCSQRRRARRLDGWMDFGGGLGISGERRPQRVRAGAEPTKEEAQRESNI